MGHLSPPMGSNEGKTHRETPAQARREVAADRLWKAYRRRSSDRARNKLVEHYQSFVRDIVRRFANRLPRTVDRGDLETAGNVGLMSAIVSFDPARGVRFESYCELRVKGALLDELRTQDWLPRPWRHLMERQKRAVEHLRSERCREPTVDEISQALDLTAAEYQQAFGTGLPGNLSGASGSGDSSDEAHNLEVVADSSGDLPGEKLTRAELLGLISQRLTQLEYRIVYLKYWEELSMREIGLVLGLSESRVCKIHARLIERLRERFSAHSEP